MIVAFSGLKFAGKDTAAECLIKRYGFKRIGLADKLKDICSKVFSIPRQDMDNPSLKETPFETPIKITNTNILDLLEIAFNDGFVFDLEKTTLEVCKIFYGKNLTSIREMLQIVGTDIYRVFVKDDIWLDYVKKFFDPMSRIVVTDARFKNERDFLKKNGAILVLIKREGQVSQSNHISENQLGQDSDYDVIIKNDSTISSLHFSVNMWFGILYNELLSNYSR